MFITVYKGIFEILLFEIFFSDVNLIFLEDDKFYNPIPSDFSLYSFIRGQSVKSLGRAWRTRKKK